MGHTQPKWLSTEEIARLVGMTPEWVRLQVVAGRLPARVFATGRRVTYRISETDLLLFLARWSARTDDPDWEAFMDRRLRE